MVKMAITPSRGVCTWTVAPLGLKEALLLFYVTQLFAAPHQRPSANDLKGAPRPEADRRRGTTAENAGTRESVIGCNAIASF